MLYVMFQGRAVSHLIMNLTLCTFPNKITMNMESELDILCETKAMNQNNSVHTQY